ncbi:hypothetical protein [Streptomyces sp. NPDC004682]
MPNETPLYPVKIPSALVEHLDGTGVMQGSDEGEDPRVKVELDGLTYPKGKAAFGEVSLNTLGWLATTAEAFVAGDDTELKPATVRACREAAQRYADAYDEGKKAEDAAQQASGIQVDGVTVPSSFGLPVYHVRDTSRVVGFLTPGNERFVSAEKAREELSKADG